MRRLLGCLLVTGAITSFSLTARSDDKAKDAAGKDSGMVMLTPSEVKWGDAPPILPKGVKFALLLGDPSKAGSLYIMRLKMPAGYKIPAHWHPGDENVTVISGTFFAGMGDKLDEKAVKGFAAGSFASMPAKMHHFGLAKAETVIEIAGVGPFGMTYINPADDPTAAPAKK
jgi:quercetin dioxygenase-like cupin family protein